MIQFLTIVSFVILWTVLLVASWTPDRTPMERLYEDDDRD